jgi:hypothetical protein
MRTAWWPLVLISCKMLHALGRATPTAPAGAKGGVQVRHAAYRVALPRWGQWKEAPGCGEVGGGGLVQGWGGAWTSSPASKNGARAELGPPLRCVSRRSAVASPT